MLLVQLGGFFKRNKSALDIAHIHLQGSHAQQRIHIIWRESKGAAVFFDRELASRCCRHKRAQIHDRIEIGRIQLQCSSVKVLCCFKVSTV
jgi:hypothetical protein